ncbi:hypothetical protein B296_00018177 [Ensete ventricosum]|uniref:Uncharacterized protein n=2 Tax=Ensete ventricosum TaxID=4639 RepID=A0A426XCM2_ENSVE|nr:hypothetical protein B296_00018177 [Ensete ventricosum]
MNPRRHHFNEVGVTEARECAKPYDVKQVTAAMNAAQTEEMEIYMDEKWKLSKKEGRSSCSESRRVTVAEGGGPLLKGSASTKEGRRTTTPRSFSSRCASLVKEQRARFYIMRRCVTMLICWRDYP